MNVKRLFLAAALLAMFPVSGALGQSSSLSVVGQWNETFGGLWTLYQEQSGSITGNLTTVGAFQNLPISCSVGVWPVTGAILSSTQFMVTATNPGGGGGVCVAWIQEYVTLTSSNAGSAIIYTPGSEPNPLGGSNWFLYSGRIIPVDPVVAQLVGTNGVTQNISAIATAAAGPLCPIGVCPLVSGAAADGVTQVVIEVLATVAGDSVQFTLTNENGDQDAVGDGGLFPLGSFIAGNGASTLTVSAQGGTNPPLAVAIWRAPQNYNRGSQYPSDATTVQRNVTLQVRLPGADGAPIKLSQTLMVVRPPVVLIHGLWSSGQGTFGGFYPANAQNLSLWNLMNPQKNEIDYSAPVTVTNPNPNPSFLGSNTLSVTQAALGFAYNAPGALQQLQTDIGNYAKSNSVAAVQADFVAHSMGGDIARTMPTLTTGPTTFLNQNNYGLGPIHKLITIGTPHGGTPVAVALLPYEGSDPNSCVRKALNIANTSLQSATVNGTSVDGAVGDLQFGVSGSIPFPTAYIAGSTLPANLALLDSYTYIVTLLGTIPVPSTSAAIYSLCGQKYNDPLALLLTPTTWNQEFGGATNDGIVTVVSQINAGSSTLIFPGVIHSPGFEELNFSPPSEVDTASGIPDEVINLLNEVTTGPDFSSSN